MIPPLGRKDRHVRELGRRLGVEIATSLHQKRRVPHRRVFPDADRLQAVGAAAMGKRGIVEGQSHIERHARVEAEGLAHDVLQVADILQVIVGWGFGGPDALEDVAAQLGDYLRVGGELVEEPGEHGGGGVAAGEEDADDLVADDGAVAREACEGVQEGVAGGGFGFLFKFGGREAQRVLDVGVNEGVEDFDAGEEGPPRDEPVEWPCGTRLALILIAAVLGSSHPARAIMFCTRCTSAKASANLTCGSPRLFTLLPRRKSVMASRVYL